MTRSYAVYDRNSVRKHRPVGKGEHDGLKGPTSPEMGKRVSDPSAEKSGIRKNSEADPPGGELSSNRDARKRSAEHGRSTEKDYNKNPCPMSIINGASADDEATEPRNKETGNAASLSDGRKEIYDCSCIIRNGKGLHDPTADKPKKPVNVCN